MSRPTDLPPVLQTAAVASSSSSSSSSSRPSTSNTFVVPPPPPTFKSPKPLAAASTSSSSSTRRMATEVQRAPAVPPPVFLDYNNRRLPEPIHLPPLGVAQRTPPMQYDSGSSSRPPMLPTIHSMSHPSLHRSHQAPQHQHQQLKSHYGPPVAPLDKILSPQPNTPPQSEGRWSPQRSPPRSILEPRVHSRHASESFTSEPLRSAIRLDPAYTSPVDVHRSTSYGSIPSPGASGPPYAPNYSAPSSVYQSPVPNYPSSSIQVAPYSHHPRTYPSPATQPPRTPTVPGAMNLGQFPDLNELRYSLKVRQQPIAARACGFGERDRRVIDPPPIIQLEVRDSRGSIVELDELRYSLNVVHCTLWNAEGTCEETALIQPDRRSTRRLMGQLVASPSVAKDEHDVEGCFFCFPDLSCRTHGRYRLRFVLMRIDPMNLHVGGFSPILTDVMSEVFQVYTAKDFPGMRPSSALTRALKLQGCNIQVKKGNEKALARKRTSMSSEEGRLAQQIVAAEEEDHENKKRRRL